MQISITVKNMSKTSPRDPYHQWFYRLWQFSDVLLNFDSCNIADDNFRNIFMTENMRFFVVIAIEYYFIWIYQCWISTDWNNGKALDMDYCDVILGTMVSQITSLTIVYSTVYSDADQRKHQSSASLAIVQGIHRGLVNSPHKWPVTWKMFPFDDVIMC